MSKIEKINGIPYIVAEIDAFKCSASAKQCYNQFSEAFGFPETKSTAITNVLLDYMRDLAWLPQKNFKLLIINHKKAEKQYTHKVENFKKILSSIQEYWDREKERCGIESENIFVIEYYSL